MKRKHYKHRVFSILGLILLPFLWQVASGQENNNNPMTVEYCALVKNPEKYDGKEVTVRATYRYGFEWSEIFCLDCRDTGKTWLEIGDITKKSEKILKKFPKDDGTINALFTGTFESSKGPFGDGGYRFRLMLKEISQAKLVTKSGADPKQLPDDTRKKVCAAAALE
jgi:hypothetical protein